MMDLLSLWYQLDWTAIASIAACVGVIATLLTVRQQLRQQNDLAVKRVEEDYLRQILEQSDRLYQFIRTHIQRREQGRAEGTDWKHVASEIEDQYREYRRSVSLSLDVIREMRRRRFPRKVTDAPMNELDRLAHDAFAANENLVQSVAKHIDYVDMWDIASFGANNAYALDVMLRVPVKEMIARLYTSRKEWVRDVR